MQRKIIAAGGDRLSDLPESILLHILSLLPDGKQVVRTSVLSRRWRFLWKFVPALLQFTLPGDRSEKVLLDFVNSVHRELHYWRSCEKIGIFDVLFEIRDERFVKDVDLWVYFATKLANVEDFVLGLGSSYFNDQRYEIPQFAYKNSSLRNLDLGNCALNPSSSVNWSSLVSLSICDLKLTDDVMEKILSGCPNLELLRLESFWGIHRLEINNVKLRTLIIIDYGANEDDVCLDILAPYIQNLQLWGFYHEIRLRNVASLVSAVLFSHFYLEAGDFLQNRVSSCLKELLHSFSHVESLELGPWCIECIYVLEWKGWQPPLSSRKFLKLNTTFEQLDLPGICRFLQSSPNLETLVIDKFNHDLRDGNKEVVRTSVLSTRWRSLWKSVPVSLDFYPSHFRKEATHDFVISTHRELHYWRSCEKIKKFSVIMNSCEERFVKDVDLWVYFAIKVANVEDFTLEFTDDNDYEAVCEYEFPQFAYKNTSLRNLVLGNCLLNPKDNVNWSSLVSLSIRDLKLIEGTMEKVLSGCPNLECLELDSVSAIHRLEISNVKLGKLIICGIQLEILAPYIQNFQLLRASPEIRLKNMASLVTAVLDLGFVDGDQLQKKESSCLKELFIVLPMSRILN